MFNFNVERYEKVVNDAIALRPQIEKAVDEICQQGFVFYWMWWNICSLPADDVLAGYYK